MSTKSFLIGAASGLSAAAAGLAGIYLYVRESRKRTAEIKGYLDLIPDLTPDQRAKVQEIRKVFLPKVDALRQSMRARRGELAELLFDDAAERSKLTAVAEQIVQHQAELERGVIEHILEEKELLTPAQRRRFHDIIVAQFSSGGVGVHDLGRRPS
jgi:Spy/CpxP family protein refolding chaperone